MLSTTANAFIWTGLLVLSLCGASLDSSGRSKEPVDSPVSDIAGFFFLSLMLMLLIYSFGYFLERMSANRMCVQGENNLIVAGLSGDNALVKELDPKTKRLLPPVHINL